MRGREWADAIKARMPKAKSHCCRWRLYGIEAAEAFAKAGIETK